MFFENVFSKTIAAESSEPLVTMQNLMYSAISTREEYLTFSKAHNCWTKQIDRIYNNTIKL